MSDTLDRSLALAEFVAGLTYEQVPAGAVDRLKQCLLDFVGLAAFAAARAESSEPFRRAVLTLAPRPGPARRRRAGRGPGPRAPRVARRRLRGRVPRGRRARTDRVRPWLPHHARGGPLRGRRRRGEALRARRRGDRELVR